MFHGIVLFMTPTLPVTIHRSFLGLVWIVLRGIAIIAILYIANRYLLRSGDTSIASELIAFITVIIIIVVLIQAITYDLATLVITDTGITITNWNSLFFSKSSETKYQEIEDATVTQGGVFSGLFGFGTLLVQTAGTQTNLSLTYVPNADSWRDYILSRVNA